MGGLANSRHAPHPRTPQATKNNNNNHNHNHKHHPAAVAASTTVAPLPPAVLTVPPAPIARLSPPAHPVTEPSPTTKATITTTPNTTTTTTTTTPSQHPTTNLPTNLPTTRPPPTARHELARYSKIIRRLQWKLPFLAQGYRQAVARVGADPAAVAEAELMFKLDFFEYYMLIERALVHLLGVFGVGVASGGPVVVGEGGGSGVGVADGGVGEGEDKKNRKGLRGSVWREGARQHRYHANVLAALDKGENPLHGTLGTGEVRVQLGRAKDLRNRWKSAGEEEDVAEKEGHRHHRRHEEGDRAGKSPEREWRTKKVAAPLDSYRLEYMLEVVFRGFDEAFKVAEGHVKRGFDWAEDCDTDMLEVADWAGGGDDEDQWEFMVEAMDWEAV